MQICLPEAGDEEPVPLDGKHGASGRAPPPDVQHKHLFRVEM